LSESEDFLHWTRPLLAIEPDANDPAQTQFYGMQMTPYGNYVMGWLSMFNTWENDFKWSKMDGTMDLDLAYSRDGYCWHRLGQGTRFIPLGEEGSWDGQMLIPSTGPIFLENEIRFYYAGTPHQHRRLISASGMNALARFVASGWLSSIASGRRMGRAVDARCDS
jgi:hypothetical protein